MSTDAAANTGLNEGRGARPAASVTRETTADLGRKATSPVVAIGRTLASVRFAVLVVLLIAAACLIGTLLPQGGEVEGFARAHPRTEQWLPLLGRLGLTHVFQSWWFLGLLAVLASSIAACTMRRFGTVRRTSGFSRRRAIGSMLAHISMLLILAGGVVRGVWGVKGYVELRQGEVTRSLQSEGGAITLPFALQLDKFEIETDGGPAPAAAPVAPGGGELLVQWPARGLTARVPVALNSRQTLAPRDEAATPENTFHIQVLNYVPDFTMNAATREVSSRSAEPNNPAILVAVEGPNYQNHRWLFAKFPDFVMSGDGHAPKESPLRMVYRAAAAAPAPVRGPIKNFRSTVRVLDGNTTRLDSVAVNSPFKHKGYTFYQSGYNPEDLTWTSLQVVRDPGVPLVYAGFVLLIIGLSIVFYLNPWLESRKARA